MRRFFLLCCLGLACLALLSSGCSDPFAPPTRVKPLPSAGGSVGTKATLLILVVPNLPTKDLEVWAMRAQHEANDKRAIFRIMGPSPTETAADQPTAVRRALAEKPSALLVYPGDSPELPKALAEAEAKGVPVVLIDKSIPAPEGSKPFTVVGPAPYEESAKKIVATTIEDLKKASQPINGTAIVLADKVVDRTSGERVAALKAAAETAKFRQVVTVPFDSTDQNAAKKAVLAAVKAYPDISVVLTDDGEGMYGAAVARGDSKGKPIFFVGGYTDYRSSMIITPPPRESCVVEGRFTEIGGLTVLTALAKLRGESVGEHAYVTSKFTKTEGAVASEAEHAAIPSPVHVTSPDAPGKFDKSPNDKDSATKPQ